MLRAISVLLLASALAGAAEPTPNVLLIYLDDFGWRDTSYAGSDFYETPRIDRLARGAMIFSDAYVGAANCAPSRACLSFTAVILSTVKDLATTPRSQASRDARWPTTP